MNKRRILKIGLLVAASYFFALSLILGSWVLSQMGEISALNNYIFTLNNKVDEQNKSTQSESNESVALQTFADEGMAVSLEFPSSWKLNLNTVATEEFSQEPYGRIIEKYEAVLNKNGSKLAFSKFLGPVDGYPRGLVQTETEFERLGESGIFRFKTENRWTYVETATCESLPGIAEDLSIFDLCYQQFFPGFGKYANSVYFEGAGELELAEADQIVLSSLNQK